MNDRKQIKFRLKEAEVYLQFLNDDIDSIESIDEDIASELAQMLSGAKIRLRESENLLYLQISGKSRRKAKGKANIP